MYTSRYFYVDILSLRISDFCEKWLAYLILGLDDTIGRPQDSEDNVRYFCHNASLRLGSQNLQPYLSDTYILRSLRTFSHIIEWLDKSISLHTPQKFIECCPRLPRRLAMQSEKMFPLIQTHKNSANLQVEMKMKDPCPTFRDDGNPTRGILCVSEAVWTIWTCIFFMMFACLGSVNIDLTRRYSGQLESSSCPYLFSVLPTSDWI